MTRTSNRAVLAAALAFGLGLPLFGARGQAGATGVLRAEPASATWTSLNPTVTPSARVHAAVAYDPDTSQTVLFGGGAGAGAGALGETWTFDGSSWTHRMPPTSPPPLEWASLAYDQASHQLILFGGKGQDGPVAGTWNWDGLTWIPLAPATSPSPRYGQAMTYDNVIHAVVLFGGFSSSTTTLGDTWTWNGSNWNADTPAAVPPARGGASLLFDASHGASVLFGGTTGTKLLGDTWAWDGTTWVQEHPAAGPSPRQDAAVGGGPSLSRTLLFGGVVASGEAQMDTWLWDGSTWLPVTASGPPGRIGGAMAFDGRNHQFVLFGGATTDGTPLGDLWVLKAVAAPPPASSTSGASSSTSGTGGPASTLTAPSSSVTRPTTTAPAAGHKPARVSAAMVATAQSVHVGDQVTLSGGGFAPHATVVVTFNSTPVVVGSAQADGTGHFSLTVAVPGDAASGQHHFEAEGAGPSGVVTTLVAPVRVGTIAARRSWVVPALMIALTVLMSAAAWAAITIFPRGRGLTMWG